MNPFTIQKHGELCKSGTPFDFYVSADLESDVMERYKVIFCLDGLAFNAKERRRLHELQKDGRTFLWFHDTGAVVDGRRSIANSRELTAGVHIYLESEDVFSASDSALMVHAASDGEKRISLPASRRITNIVTEKVTGCAKSFSIPMKFGETALFLLEEPDAQEQKFFSSESQHKE